MKPIISILEIFMKKKIPAMIALIMTLLTLSCSKKAALMPTTTPPQYSSVFYAWDKFSMGADLSYVNEIEDFGGVYKDSNTVKDAFTIFKNRGANTVRVRLWHNQIGRAHV